MSLVAPLARPSLPPPSRPALTSQVVQSAKRNLFGSSSDDGHIDAMLSMENQLTADKLLKRYNLDIRKLDEKCNQQISASASVSAPTQLYIKSGRKDKTFPASLPYARLQSVKSTYRVRKLNNGNSNVPKPKCNQNNNNNNNTNNNNNNNNTKVDSHISEMGATGDKEDV